MEVYRHLGFVPTDTERLTDGLRYTPMRFDGSGPSEEEWPGAPGNPNFIKSTPNRDGSVPAGGVFLLGSRLSGRYFLTLI